MDALIHFLISSTFTGTNRMVMNEIKISFFKPAHDFGRNPVGKTCGCVLELPTTYESYASFNKEFTDLLESNVWSMELR